MNDEGSHWSDPDCVLCSWVPHLDTGEDDTTDLICSRCREYDMASTAHRVREPRAFYLKQAKTCEAWARLGTEKDIAPFSRLMWERTALRWRLAALRGFRWIPNTRTLAVLFPRMTAEVQPASAAQRRQKLDPRTAEQLSAALEEHQDTCPRVPAAQCRQAAHRPDPAPPGTARQGRCAVLGRCVLTAPAVRRGRWG